MKLTRRKSIFTLATVFVIIGYRSRRHRQLVQVEFAKRPFQRQLLTNPDFLSNGEIDTEQIYHEFLKAAAGGLEDKPALLYQGFQTSPYKEQIKDYPTRLRQKPNGNLLNGADDATFSPYPAVGQLPKIDESRLNFLHEDIKEACICVGSFSAGEFKVKWLGRNALSNQEFWSATKIIPILNLVSLFNTKIPDADINLYKIRGVDQQGIQRRFPFYDLVRDIVSYEENIATSNSLAQMFKRFSGQLKLENWLKSITANKNLVFRGDYGEQPFIDQPQVIEQITEKAIVMASEPPNPNWTDNTISAYDLTRMISMLGWHNYIPPESRLPGVNWKSLESVIKAMGTDSARFTDLAIKKLGLQNALDSVVIISKFGNGSTSLRKRTEAVYVALVQFVVRSPNLFGEQTKVHTLSIALRGARALEPRDLNREFVELDARMATEVTNILQREIFAQLG